MEHLAQHVESLIFTSESAISLKEIKSCLENIIGVPLKDGQIESAIEELKERYAAAEFSFEVVEMAEGYQFLTKADYFQTIATYLKLTTKKRLSRAAMETLAIISYKQPVTKSSMEQIRGVSCDYSVQKLLEKELIVIAGRSDGPGRPLLYGTSAKFMDYMGIKDLNEMPKLKDFKTADNEIGEAAPIEETTNLENQAASSENSEESQKQEAESNVIEASIPVEATNETNVEKEEVLMETTEKEVVEGEKEDEVPGASSTDESIKMEDVDVAGIFPKSIKNKIEEE